VHRYEDEALCDRHVGIFLKAIDTVARLPGQGFAAIKVTALGSPALLERMSGALLEIRRLFRAADADGDGFVTRAEFDVLYRQLFPGAAADAPGRAFATLDVEGAGRVDIISWTHRIKLEDMPGMVERMRRQGACTAGQLQMCPPSILLCRPSFPPHVQHHRAVLRVTATTTHTHTAHVCLCATSPASCHRCRCCCHHCKQAQAGG
jgi:hypothetical protein